MTYDFNKNYNFGFAPEDREDRQTNTDIFNSLESKIDSVMESGVDPRDAAIMVFEGLRSMIEKSSDEENEAAYGMIYAMSMLFMNIGDEDPELSARDHLFMFADAIIEILKRSKDEDGGNEQS